MKLVQKFRKIIIEQNLITENSKIFIAVSGGIDSIVLFSLFHLIKTEFKLTLKIIHLNHKIRGAEADRDQLFVEQLGEKYSIPVISKKINVIQYAKKNKYSIEESARILRYKFFTEEMENSDFDYTALGHHADDQVETILDHLLRGSGIRGLGGMKYKNDNYIRPLLKIYRNEIETYAQQNVLKYLIDSTNSELKYKRNKIRHKLIPHLEEYNPAITKGLLRTGQIIHDTELFLINEAEKAFSKCLKNIEKGKIILDINYFFNYFSIIQVYVLYHILTLFDINKNILNSDMIYQLLSIIQKRKSGTKFCLNHKWEFLIDHDELIFHLSHKNTFEFEIKLNTQYSIQSNKKIFQTCLIDRTQLPKSFSSNKNIEYIDFDKVTEPLIIRNFKNGDRFTPLNMKGQKKVSDFFTDNKIPLHLRKEIPLLTCTKSIIWIIGYQIDDRYKVTNTTKKILKLEIKK